MAVVLLLSVPVGILCARFQNVPLDLGVRFLTYFFASLPSFFLALAILYLFSLRLGWFSVIASGGVSGYVMPVAVLSLTLSAWYIRQVRSVVLTELSKDYIEGARGLGHLAMEAITARDYPVIQGYVVWMALAFLVVNFLVDLSYGLIDPRIRRGAENT